MSSGFRSMHPVVALLYYAGLLLFTLLVFHPLFLATEIAGLLALLLLQGQGRLLVRGLPFMLLMAASVALLNPLFSHRGRIFCSTGWISLLHWKLYCTD